MIIGQGLCLGALTTPNLLVPGSRAVAIVTYLGFACGLIGTTFAKQLAGKSDELRLAETLPDTPHERRTDKKPGEPS